MAIFALALVPTISRALSFAQGVASWAEVCTPQGTKVVTLEAGAASSDPAPTGSVASHLDHCPLCGLGAGAWALPSAGPAGLAAPPVVQWVPPLFLRAPRPLFAWRSAQPRGPPSLS